MFTTFTQIIRIFQQRRQRIRRNLEAARLRYARRHTYPQYERCMNCGTPLKGMYCYRCGQYALDIHQPLWKYIRQYFENMYQFDGKIWMTLRLMFTRPGFLTNEFNAGKINSYVHPFRLYMCVSVVFFAIFFMVAGDRTGTALTLMSTNEVPKSLLQKFRQGSLSPDTTVYALDAASITEALKHKGVGNVDSVIHIASIGEDIPFYKVTLPHELLDSCFFRTSLSDSQQEDMFEQWKVYHFAERILDEEELAESQRVLSLPIDTLTGQLSAPLYSCMRATTNEQLRQQAVAACSFCPYSLSCLRLLSVVNGCPTCTTLPMPYTSTPWPCSCLYPLPFGFWRLWDPEPEEQGNLPRCCVTIFLRCCCIFICSFRCVWFMETVGAKQ